MYHIIFWTLIAANIVVSVIAIAQWYRDERKLGTPLRPERTRP